MAKIFEKKRGVTLAEIIIASSLSVIVIMGILTLNNFVHSTWKESRAKSNIMAQLETCVEWLQKEIRLTDGHCISYYPSTSATNYTAIAFPHATDTTGDGFVELDSDSHIVWNKTIFYHTYNNAATGKVELRRTVLDGYDTDSSVRQDQLNSIVGNGKPVASTPHFDWWNSSTGTRVLCENNNITLCIVPSLKTFDGYSASLDRSGIVEFGSVLLKGYDHYITFSIVGKNPLSGGYNLGIDTFSNTPSGCIREGEEAVLRPTIGTVTNEDMKAFGAWSGYRQLEFTPNAEFPLVSPLSFDFFYDEWIETNFSRCALDNTSVNYDRRTGHGGEVDASPSAIDDVVARLGGYGNSWSALAQTQAAGPTEADLSCAGNGITVRNVISSFNIDIEGRAIRISFNNTAELAGGNDMIIDYASIMNVKTENSADGDVATRKIITFNDSPGPVTIPANSSVLSDWIDIDNFDSTQDYLVTFHIQSHPGNHKMRTWARPAADPDHLDSYYVLDSSLADARDDIWTDGVPPANSVTSQNTIYAVESIFVSYFSFGVVTSQVYDRILSPLTLAGCDLTWKIRKNNYGQYATGGKGADLIIKLRSGNDKDALKASNDWSGAAVIDTLSATTGSSPFLWAVTGRYLQLRLEFYSKPTPGQFDYEESCVLKRIGISWCSGNRMAEITGNFTTRPNYGIFSVSVDGSPLIKGINITFTISEKVGAKTISKYLTAEVESRNTGK